MFRSPSIPLLGTLVHTLVFPLLAVMLISAALYFNWQMSASLMAGIMLIAACPSADFLPAMGCDERRDSGSDALGDWNPA